MNTTFCFSNYEILILLSLKNRLSKYTIANISKNKYFEILHDEIQQYIVKERSVNYQRTNCSNMG